jgi:hypothetical protein
MSAHTPGPWTINEHGKIVSPSGETIVVAGVPATEEESKQISDQIDAAIAKAEGQS